MNQQEQSKKIGQLIAKCWSDESFKQKLLADPAAALRAEGVESPAGLSLKAVENTDEVFHLVIPARPTDLSDEDLDEVAAGGRIELIFCNSGSYLPIFLKPLPGGGLSPGWFQSPPLFAIDPSKTFTYK